MNALLDRVDHLVYATPDVDASVAQLANDLGVRAAPGGRHEGRGTRNALLAIGPRAYLEIIGPDRSQPAPAGPRWFGIDALTTPRLVTWAATMADIRTRVDPALISIGSRRRADGIELHWALTAPAFGPSVVPFLIDWGASPHPAATAPSGAALIGLRAEHPHPADAQAALGAWDLALTVSRGDDIALFASLQTPRGLVVLR